jgi:hypothetical protein
VTPAVGWCGLDRVRRPLRGDEIRGCWQAAPVSAEPPPRPPAAPPPARLRGFVPLEGPRAEVPPPIAEAPPAPPIPMPGFERGTLFDLEA